MSRGDPLPTAPWSFSRADYILFSLPTLFAGVYGASYWLVQTGTHALAVAALVCCLIVIDGLFVHPPDGT